MPSAVDEKPTKRSSSMRNLFEPGPFSLRLALTHLTHIFMLVVNILVLITGAMKWEQRVNIDPARVRSPSLGHRLSRLSPNVRPNLAPHRSEAFSRLPMLYFKLSSQLSWLSCSGYPRPSQ